MITYCSAVSETSSANPLPNFQTIKAMRVLLVVDSFDREYVAMRLTAAALRKHGATVRMCSRPILGMTYNRFQPQVVVLPKTHKITGLEDIHRSCAVVLAQAESFVGSEDSFRYLSAHLRKECVDLVCCWGPFDHDFYIQNGLFPADRVHLTGHPMIESWYLPTATQKISSTNPVVGITSSLRAFTHKANGNRINPFRSIIGIEEVGDSGYFLPPYHAEDWIAFEASWVRIIYQLIKENPDIKFSLRPHPLENPVHYKEFERFPNLTVDARGHIAEWLTSLDVLCSSFSGSMLDGYFRRIPVVSIRNLIPARILEGIHPSIPGIPHERHFVAPDTLAGARDELHKSWQSIPELDALGKRVFNFPDSKRPSVRLAETIVRHAPDIYRTKGAFVPLPESRFERLCGPFSWSPDARLAMLHLRDILKHTNITATAYGRHRFLQNRKYASLFDRLSA